MVIFNDFYCNQNLWSPSLDNKDEPSDGINLLYIEDNPANLRLVTQLLGREDSINLLSASEPVLGLELYQAISSQLSATREMLVAVGQRSAEERLAGFLLTLSRRNASRGQDASTIVLPMTRSDIADYLGMTIETVSRMMTKMRKQGLIDIEQCILVTINDAEALADIASGKLR